MSKIRILFEIDESDIDHLRQAISGGLRVRAPLVEPPGWKETNETNKKLLRSIRAGLERAVKKSKKSS